MNTVVGKSGQHGEGQRHDDTHAHSDQPGYSQVAPAGFEEIMIIQELISDHILVINMSVLDKYSLSLPALHAVEPAEHDCGVGEHEGEPAQHAQGIELHGFGGLVSIADGKQFSF